MSGSPGHEFLPRARALHAESIVLDSHVDTTQRLLDPAWDFTRRDIVGHVDLPRLREGGINAVVFAIWSPAAEDPAECVASARRQIAAVNRLVQSLPEHLALARRASDVHEAVGAGRMAVLLAIEGGHLIGQSLDVLREFRAEGSIYLTLTHGTHNALADSAGIHEPLSPRHGGLSPFGRSVVVEMNRIGMLVDVSHVGDATFRDVAEISSAPFVASHSSCRAVSPHRRNLTDAMMETVAKSGGVVQITFPAAFVDPDFPAIDPAQMRRVRLQPPDPARPPIDHVTPLQCLVDHVDHALKRIGPEHVGIGSDFDGTLMLPEGLEDCSKLPMLTAALLERGWHEDDLVGLLGANMLRTMDRASGTASSSRDSRRR
ncbi:MAG: dipeptidase [Phycisphaerae bacterium]|nr:dipeptidase [Phycisphaerae bacterium]